MKGKVVWEIMLVTSIILLPALVSASIAPDDAQKAKILNKTYRMQIPFIENKGQIGSKDVCFYANTFGGTLFVEKDGTITYSLPFEDKRSVVIKEIFTDRKLNIKGVEPAPTKINYFKGSDKNRQYRFGFIF